MSWDDRDVRRSMDVFTRDDVYLGTVLEVVTGRAETEAGVPEEALQASAVNGELLGPAPTAPIGNAGPANQSAGARYGVRSDRAWPLGRGRVVVGRWWGLVGRRVIPLDLVLTVSLERVILEVRPEEL